MRKNLVICPADDNSLHRSWAVPERTFDILIIYYGDNDENIKGTYDYLTCKKGYKYELAQEVLIAHFMNDQSFYDKYEYIWFPDSDLEISAADIDRMFVLAKERGAEIFTPSIANYLYPDKYSPSEIWASWDQTKTNPNTIYRRITHPEAMMPGFSIKAWENIFLKSIILFPRYRVGWGIEAVWHALSINLRLGLKIPNFIFDDVRVIHTKPVGKGSELIHTIGENELHIYETPYLKNLAMSTLELFYGPH